jgi:hypothetical protein
MKPREECLIVVKFTPRKAKKSIARLFIERVSGEPAKFIVTPKK